MGAQKQIVTRFGYANTRFNGGKPHIAVIQTAVDGPESVKGRDVILKLDRNEALDLVRKVLEQFGRVEDKVWNLPGAGEGE